jgi:hypothetical protein
LRIFLNREHPTQVDGATDGAKRPGDEMLVVNFEVLRFDKQSQLFC